MGKNQKDNLVKLITSNAYFLLPYLIIMLTGTIFLFTTGKGDTLLWLNGNNTHFLDGLFAIATFLGDGIFSLIIVVFLLFFSIRYSIMCLASYLGGGLIAQILKYIFDTPRPRAYFAPGLLHFVNGVHVYSAHSFPSGHSASAFSLFLLLAFITPVKYAGFLYVIIASLIALSRMYLAQHFLIDVYFGSVIGVISTIYFYYLFAQSDGLKDKSWLNDSLLTMLKKKK